MLAFWNYEIKLMTDRDQKICGTWISSDSRNKEIRRVGVEEQ